MSGQEYRVGEVVDITIKGVRVGGRGIPEDPRRLYLNLGPWDDGVSQGREWFLTIPSAVESVTVTRVAPPEWPPRPGDLWRDGDGGLWFCCRYATDLDEWVDVLGPAFESQHPRSGVSPADALAEIPGPLTLVHREPEGGGRDE